MEGRKGTWGRTRRGRGNGRGKNKMCTRLRRKGTEGRKLSTTCFCFLDVFYRFTLCCPEPNHPHAKNSFLALARRPRSQSPHGHVIPVPRKGKKGTLQKVFAKMGSLFLFFFCSFVLSFFFLLMFKVNSTHKGYKR